MITALPHLPIVRETYSDEASSTDMPIAILEDFAGDAVAADRVYEESR